MARPYLSARTLAALALLAVVAAVCVSLGNWQLDRAAERDAISQAIERGQQSTPLALLPGTPAEQLQDWRAAQARGIWLHRFTVLLDNRNFNGRPGFWVATPLLLDQETNTALLVLRGWLARPLGPGQALPDLAPPEGVQEVSGQIRQRVPRLFELWSFSGRDPNALPGSFPAADGKPPRVQNLDLDDYAAATGLKLIPVVLEQTSDAAVEQHTDLVREWPLPPTDSDTNRGYALQWFSFAAIAVIAWILIAWRALRKRAARPGTPRS
ncbi:SURF1 family protein [Pusillimonas noertemannii]|uniref:SURF1-like protein n=1 Tax=Pusillimonas noertemannii TaxID=305977 RepID=A0A2U1CNP5_9BURK|nr:SURF1 family protein [Pusillimonas noertemannii]NYT68352.1 SURF1 family protein [Pusillimonas noertemannii]PVY62633.1 cytochrome oxidase assembly protein ShyY1 [Pusillimonas noertemannii]TFL10424.1 SURF1 family protein [Pusillimonas noertemannii]